eukprot:TRINITY_DN5855_c0_g1_i2.p1 TRINITY_DN5855_c0_g1~~TRINITY_DN5855_c0_g1_i2.p1  ORF type:complete len:770 (+),score=115.80 TRINITY_DN5855_c0_g1_i2:49-2358(+)
MRALCVAFFFACVLDASFAGNPCKFRHTSNLHLYDFSSLGDKGPVNGDWLISHPTKPWMIYANMCEKTNYHCNGIETDVCLVQENSESNTQAISVWNRDSVTWSSGNTVLDETFTALSVASISSCEDPFVTDASNNEQKSTISVSTKFILTCEDHKMRFKHASLSNDGCSIELHFGTDAACFIQPVFIAYIVLASICAAVSVLLGRLYSRKEEARQSGYLRHQFPYILDMVRHANKSRLLICLCYAVFLVSVVFTYFESTGQRELDLLFLGSLSLPVILASQQLDTVLGSLCGAISIGCHIFYSSTNWLSSWFDENPEPYVLMIGFLWVLWGFFLTCYFFSSFIRQVYERRPLYYAPYDCDWEMQHFEKDVSTLLHWKKSEAKLKHVDDYVLQPPEPLFYGLISRSDFEHLKVTVLETLAFDFFKFLGEQKRSALDEELEHRYIPFSQRFLMGLAGSIAIVLQNSIFVSVLCFYIRDMMTESAADQETKNFWNGVLIAVVLIVAMVLVVCFFLWKAQISMYRRNILKMRKGHKLCTKESAYSVMEATLYVGVQVGYTYVGYVFIVGWCTLLALFLLAILMITSIQSTAFNYISRILVNVLLGSFLVTSLKKILVKFLFTVDRRFMLKNHHLFGIYDFISLYLDIIVGFWSALVRIAKGMVLLGVLFIRTDISIYPAEFAHFDQGNAAFVGMMIMEHTYNNPVVWVFLQILASQLQIQKHPDFVPKSYQRESFESLTDMASGMPLLGSGESKVSAYVVNLINLEKWSLTF